MHDMTWILVKLKAAITAKLLGSRDINSLLPGLEEILGLLEGIGRVAESIKSLILKKNMFKNSIAV